MSSPHNKSSSGSGTSASTNPSTPSEPGAPSIPHFTFTDAIGEACSQQEWRARRRGGLCQWCCSVTHSTTNCPIQLREKQESQARALGNNALGAEKFRRRMAGLCVYCGAKDHFVSQCLKKKLGEARAAAQAHIKQMEGARGKTKEERRQAWLERQKEASEASEEQVSSLSEERKRKALRAAMLSDD